ncbi:hypothetical protein II906_11310 [bacterium]|nr:hypothetical protein [bacterium]
MFERIKGKIIGNIPTERNKPAQKMKDEVQQKSVEASSQDALAIQGMAQVGMSSVQQESFPTEVKELSDEEFEELQHRLKKAARHLPKTGREEIKSFIPNKSNIFVIGTVLNSGMLNNIPKDSPRLHWIINSVRTPEQAELGNAMLASKNFRTTYRNWASKGGDIIYYCKSPAQCEFAKSFFLNESSFDKDSVLLKEGYSNKKNEWIRGDTIKYLIEKIETPEQARGRGMLLAKIFSDSKLCKNADINDYFTDIILSANNEDEAKVKSDIADAILNDDNLYETNSIRGYLPLLMMNTQTEEEKENKLSVLNLYSKDKKLQITKGVFESIGYLASNADSSHKRDIVKKILSDERLYSNEDFMDQAHQCFPYKENGEEDFSVKNALLNKILDNWILFNNRYKAIAGIPWLIRGTKNQDELEAKSIIIDKLVSKINGPGSYAYVTDIYDNVPQIISNADNSEKAKTSCEIADIIMGNETLKQKIYPKSKIYTTFREKDDASNILNILKNIVNNEDTANNKSIMNAANAIVSNPKEAPFMEKIMNCIFSNDILKSKKEFTDTVGEIMLSTNTEEQADYKIKLLNKIAEDEKLHDNPVFMEAAASIIQGVYNEHSYEIANTILNNEKYYNNELFMKYVPQFIKYIPNEQSKKFAQRIMSDDLYQNEELLKSAYIISNTSTKESIEIVNLLLTDKNLYENKNFADLAYNIGCIHYDENKVEIARKILSDEKLYNNGKIIKHARNMIDYTERPDQRDFILRLLDDEELTSNEDLLSRLYSVLGAIQNYDMADDAYRIIKQNKELPVNQIVILIQANSNLVTASKLRKLTKTIGKEAFNRLNRNDIITAATFVDIYHKKNINEIQMYQKRDLVLALIGLNTDLFNMSEPMRDMFPLLPKNQEEYCSIMPALVRSLGIETNELNDSQIKDFNFNFSELSDALKAISDEDFNNLNIEQKYSQHQFIKDTLDIVKDLDEEKRQKVYDYFGFELRMNKDASNQFDINGQKRGFSIVGYPVNLNNGKKLAQINDAETKEIIEKLRPYVIKFSQNNNIEVNNQKIELGLNSIAQALPELHTMIGKAQHRTHDFDLMKHSLKVMREIVKQEEFNKLSESDKRLMLIAALTHDITKAEGKADATHAKESAFDAFFITNKLDLNQDEKIKLFTLISNHEWLKHINDITKEETKIKKMQDIAYDFRHDNLFDMALMFTKADLKAVKRNDDFFNKMTVNLPEYSAQIKENIKELQKSQPLLPVTKFPKASTIDKAITKVNSDGSTNIKGVYKDKDGLTIIKFNEVKDWEAIGFPKGSTSKGIKCKTSAGDDVNTGNIKFFAHGLDYPNQLVKFDAFSLLESDALLSVSYAERPESKYRFFRAQGVILDCDTKYIHGGGETDSGSGCGKQIQKFKDNYIFDGVRKADRVYVSDLIKEALNMSDEEYIQFIKENQNKPFSEIEPKEIREKLIKAFSSINSNTRRGNRSYNEMYISNPKPPMAVFAYNMHEDGKKLNPVEFLNNYYNNTNHEFLRQYALERDIPFVVFGD